MASLSSLHVTKMSYEGLLSTLSHPETPATGTAFGASDSLPPACCLVVFFQGGVLRFFFFFCIIFFFFLILAQIPQTPLPRVALVPLALESLRHDVAGIVDDALASVATSAEYIEKLIATVAERVDQVGWKKMAGNMLWRSRPFWRGREGEGGGTAIIKV